MPIHLYECSQDHIFEVRRPLGITPQKREWCPECFSKKIPYIQAAEWRPPTGTSFIIKDGGTGAQKGSR